MEKAINQALREVAVKRLKEMLDDLPRRSAVDNGENTTDFLRLLRMKWDGRPLDVVEGTKK
ncbi:hypothetical protein [Mesorhizobium sp.]|uniref:hypothetical protein n=1 Tax=Mesorhizobium sp. TaxID=1871066 RepID=UPI001217F523|nr:hypothetical protein [Mesorhizobium sp.]TIN11072.1 MAG: hypothetical protein E5Y14_06885 [Mesorhizobium sp.]